MLDDLKVEFKTIEALEKSSMVKFDLLKDEITLDTNRQHHYAVATAKQSLKDLQRLVLFIQESDRKLLSGSSNKAPVRRWQAIQPGRHQDAPGLENTLTEEVQKVIYSFDVSSAAVDSALESVCHGQELVVDFQHSTALPLEGKIEKFLYTVENHVQKTARDLGTQNRQLDKMRDHIKNNTDEQAAAQEKATSKNLKTNRWRMAAGALLMLMPIGPIAAVAGVAAGIAGLVALNQLRKEAEQLLQSLQERKEEMDEKIIKLKEQVQELNAVKTKSHHLKRCGKNLESRAQNLSHDARDITLEIQYLKEHTSQFAEQFSELRSRTVDPLRYCQTRQCVLEALDEAFQDITALPMAEQIRSITLDVKDRDGCA
ncbi:hypothetical protein MMC11_006255 [Xylographa trunciseda]|nr:hypothetical protein [Xylographa trunciseda]